MVADRQLAVGGPKECSPNLLPEVVTLLSSLSQMTLMSAWQEKFSRPLRVVLYLPNSSLSFIYKNSKKPGVSACTH